MWHIEHERALFVLSEASFLSELHKRILICHALCYSLSLSGVFIMISVFYSEQLSVMRRLWQAWQRVQWERLSWLAPRIPHASHDQPSPFICTPPNEPWSLTSPGALTNPEILTSSNEGDASPTIPPARCHRQKIDWKPHGSCAEAAFPFFKHTHESLFSALTKFQNLLCYFKKKSCMLIWCWFSFVN